MIKNIANIFQKVSLLIGISIMVLFFVPMMFGIMPYIVLSGSMEPEIKTGSVAYINSHAKISEIAKGDIIGFNTQEGQVTHRVVEIKADGSFITKGDNNEEVDEAPVPVDKVKGKTIFSLPFLGRLVALVKSKQGIPIVVAFVLFNVLCIIYDKKIYEQDVPNSFKEAIMKCENLDEIKKVIIEEMDSFKEQLIEDVSSVNLKQLQQSEQKLLGSGNNIDNLKETESNIYEKLENCDYELDIQNESEDQNIEEFADIFSKIDSIDEDEIDLDKVKSELVRYDNPKLIELRNNLKEKIENSKVVSIEDRKVESSNNTNSQAKNSKSSTKRNRKKKSSNKKVS